MMQLDDISQLPIRYQKQILRKIAEQEVEKPLPAQEQKQKSSKFHNQPTESSGIRFDSKKEARRFEELMEKVRLNEISDLKLQVNFTLQEGYTKPDGERVRPIVYKADFTYLEKGLDGLHTLYIVEDVKSKATKTRVYEMKRKLLREKFHLEIREV